MLREHFQSRSFRFSLVIWFLLGLLTGTCFSWFGTQSDYAAISHSLLTLPRKAVRVHHYMALDEGDVIAVHILHAFANQKNDEDLAVAAGRALTDLKKTYADEARAKKMCCWFPAVAEALRAVGEEEQEDRHGPCVGGVCPYPGPLEGLRATEAPEPKPRRGDN